MRIAVKEVLPPHLRIAAIAVTFALVRVPTPGRPNGV
jgi:hypothetical protein